MDCGSETQLRMGVNLNWITDIGQGRRRYGLRILARVADDGLNWITDIGRGRRRWIKLDYGYWPGSQTVD